MLSLLKPCQEWDLSQWSYGQIREIYSELTKKIDYHQERLLRYNYRSCRYIDSKVKLNHELFPALDQIILHVRNNISYDIAKDLFPELIT
jgi:hypothetical protein